MKKILLFFTNPIVGGILSFIGLLEILFSIPSSFFMYQVPLWIFCIIISVIIVFSYLWKRIKILYYIKVYTSDSFGGSYQYKWRWVKTSYCFNVYGYFPDCIDVEENTRLNSNITIYNCAQHYINNKDLLQEYIMLSLYDKVENTNQTNLFIQQMHNLESHYSK